MRCEQTHGGAADGKIGVMRPPSRVGEEVSFAGGGATIVRKSACIMLNICTTHNGDYAPFRRGLFDPLP